MVGNRRNAFFPVSWAVLLLRYPYCRAVSNSVTHFCEQHQQLPHRHVLSWLNAVVCMQCAPHACGGWNLTQQQNRSRECTLAKGPALTETVRPWSAKAALTAADRIVSWSSLCAATCMFLGLQHFCRALHAQTWRICTSQQRCVGLDSGTVTRRRSSDDGDQVVSARAAASGTSAAVQRHVRLPLSAVEGAARGGVLN